MADTATNLHTTPAQGNRDCDRVQVVALLEGLSRLRGDGQEYALEMDGDGNLQFVTFTQSDVTEDVAAIHFQERMAFMGSMVHEKLADGLQSLGFEVFYEDDVRAPDCPACEGRGEVWGITGYRQPRFAGAGPGDAYETWGWVDCDECDGGVVR